MSKHFEAIEAKLSSIENLVRDLKQSKQPFPENHEEQLLTVHGAAEFLSVTVPTVYKKVSCGELPAMKRNKRLYFSKSELIEYLKAGRVQTEKTKGGNNE